MALPIMISHFTAIEVAVFTPNKGSHTSEVGIGTGGAPKAADATATVDDRITVGGSDQSEVFAAVGIGGQFGSTSVAMAAFEFKAGGTECANARDVVVTAARFGNPGDAVEVVGILEVAATSVASGDGEEAKVAAAVEQIVHLSHGSAIRPPTFTLHTALEDQFLSRLAICDGTGDGIL